MLIIAGDTGSGKTTQLPKLCLEAGRGKNGRIGCTQPRRIAATSVAERVAEEIKSKKHVGYKIRFSDRTSNDTLIKFMTDGVLLAETKHDRLLRQYDTLIIDEAHERSLNIDFLLGYLKNLLIKRPELKLIISSATIDTEKFSKHFNNAPIVSVSGRLHEITLHYHETEQERDNEEESYVEQAVSATHELATRPGGGDILIFMPTERDIHDTVDKLRHHYGDSHLLLPLFGRLQGIDQRRIFHPAKKNKIIVATNIAETSITVPGIRYVIDTGLARIAKYNVRTGTTSLRVTRISRASCDQRKGRCGRTGPGVCIRLYSEEDYLNRNQFTLPEIQRSNLAEVILQMISLGLGDPSGFPFIDHPTARAIKEGFRSLHELGALTEQKKMTKNGRLMSRLPLDPCISRIIIESANQGSLREIKILAAALSIQDPRVRPLEKEHKADEIHRQFADKQSDFLTLLNIWNGFHDNAISYSKSQLSKFCKNNYLSWQRMREWLDIHEQIDRLLKNVAGFTTNETPATYEGIHIALTSGFLRNICRKKEKNRYVTGDGREVVIFPGSALYNKGGQWIVASGFFETSQLFARNNGGISVDWLEKLGGELCKRSWSSPHWEKKSGRVMAMERVSLFGHQIVAGRRVNYGRINKKNMQEAREIFIRSALIDNKIGRPYSFLTHNTAQIEKLRNYEDRTRRRGILVDDEVLFSFYDGRLGNIYDRFTLNRLLSRKKNDHFLQMTESDICHALPSTDELYRYPASLKNGALEIKLQYAFEPGSDTDGVTALIPEALVSHIKPALFEWLVPGMLEEKILFLFKRLPKRLRRLLVPLPDAVDLAMDGLELYKGSLYQELERVIRRSFQIAVQRADWQTDNLPQHLKMRFKLIDSENKVKDSFRSFHDLSQHRASYVETVNVQAQVSLPEAREISIDDLDTIDNGITLSDESGSISGFFHPALHLDEQKRIVTLCYESDQLKALQYNRQAMQFFYGLAFGKEVNALKKQCKILVNSNTASWLALGLKASAAELRRRVLTFALNAIFPSDIGALPGTVQYRENCAQVKELGFHRMANQVLELVAAILKKRKEAYQKISRWETRAKQHKNFSQEIKDEYLTALNQILPNTFFETRTAAELKHTARYLQALVLRIERAEHSPQKDRKKAERLSAPLSKLTQLNQYDNDSIHCITCQKEYLELIEEFRVSVFAPELGTARPVSEKKLQQKWQEVEDLCHTVE